MFPDHSFIQPKFYTDVIGKLQSDIKNSLQFCYSACIQLQLIHVDNMSEFYYYMKVENIFNHCEYINYSNITRKS